MQINRLWHLQIKLDAHTLQCYQLNSTLVDASIRFHSKAKFSNDTLFSVVIKSYYIKVLTFIHICTTFLTEDKIFSSIFWRPLFKAFAGRDAFLWDIIIMFRWSFRRTYIYLPLIFQWIQHCCYSSTLIYFRFLALNVQCFQKVFHCFTLNIVFFPMIKRNLLILIIDPSLFRSKTYWYSMNKIYI